MRCFECPNIAYVCLHVFVLGPYVVFKMFRTLIVFVLFDDTDIFVI